MPAFLAARTPDGASSKTSILDGSIGPFWKQVKIMITHRWVLEEELELFAILILIR